MVRAGSRYCMKDQPIQTKVTNRRSTVGRILLEAVLVAVVGATFAFAANRISPRGLSLTRNYFPTGTNDADAGGCRRQPPETAPGTNATILASPPSLAAQMKPPALQMVDRLRAVELFHDSHLKPGAIVFIDARDEEHYLAAMFPALMNSTLIIRKNIFPPCCRFARRRNKSWFTAMAATVTTARRRPSC